MTSTERDMDRNAHPPACDTNPDGTRCYTPQPNPQNIVRNFGRPYTEEQQ